MAPKHEDHLVGKTFEKCRILAKLGTGGMGSVWLAEHFGLGRKVAVKILPPEMGRDPEYVARFMREATTAGRMEHPNIVQIHDVGYAEGRHFIVMQYVDGESLSTVVENLGAMEPRDAAKIAAGMLRGLQHAHEEGVVHRDVKPDNVLITKGDEPKLLDFGLAIETETALQITKDGMVVGTPYYLAPEQARGQKATPLCDVYAAGVTLYYLLTGKRPFVGATALAVLNKHIHEPPVPPMKHKPAIPRPLNDIVLKMMAKKPADRYQSAGAAANDLEAFLKGKEIQVRVPITLPFGLDRLTRKQQILAGAGAGTGLLLLLILLIAAFSGGGARTPPDKTAQNPVPPAAVKPPLSDKLLEVVQFEKKNKDNFAAYPDVFTAYDDFIKSTTSADYIEKARQGKKAFYDYVEKRAGEELDKALKEPDPYRRVKALRDYPQPLLDLTPIDKRLREERAIALGEAETKYLSDEKKLDARLKEGKFKEAAPLLDQLLPVAEGTRRTRLERLKAELPRLEREFNDAVLRKVSDEFALVHSSFEESMARRETAAAYFRVSKFLKDQAEEERSCSRVPALNYDVLFRATADNAFKDTALLQVRSALASAFLKAQDSLPYRMLSDLQDALDVEMLVTEASQGLYSLFQKGTEIRLATYGSSGRVIVNAKGFGFQPKGGAEKSFTTRDLHPEDLVALAAVFEGVTVEKLYEGNDLLCRAAGAAYLHSAVPERWAQAARWFRRAEEIGLSGLGFRLEGFRERGYQEVRDRIAASKAQLDKKNYEAAKQPLAAIQAAWAHDPLLKEQIGRAMAAILVAEVLQYERARDPQRLKQAARALRTGYPGLYREEDVFAPYANALRQTGTWSPAGSLLNDDWTWEGKAQGTPAPVDDETRSSRGLRLKPNQSIELSAVKTRGASGAAVELSVSGTFSSFASGFKFDASTKDGRYRRLVVRDTGELTLYEFDGFEEKRSASASLGRKLAAGQWIDLAFVAEGGDIACYAAERPLLLVAAALPGDRDLGLTTTGEANFRSIRLRK
ncbi:MAG: protein kinase [Planctomycetes bacterium]|nr:protein kinase [Planctomycetota bacterium]